MVGMDAGGGGGGTAEVPWTRGSQDERLGRIERERCEGGMKITQFVSSLPPARKGKADERTAGEKDKASSANGGRTRGLLLSCLAPFLALLEAPFGCDSRQLQCKHEERGTTVVHMPKVDASHCGFEYGDGCHFQNGTNFSENAGVLC